MPEVVRPRIGVGGHVGEEFVGPGVVFLKRRCIAKFDLIEHVLGVGQCVTGLNRALAGVNQSKGGLCALNGHERLPFGRTVLEGGGKGIEHTEIVTGDGYIAGNGLHHGEQHHAHEENRHSPSTVGLRKPDAQET